MQLILDHSSSAVDDGMEEARGRVVSVVMEDQRTVAAIREFASTSILPLFFDFFADR